MHDPRVSIIMATWNRGHAIGRGIQSAREQTFTDWELVIIGDGPPSDTEAIIREWVKKDERIIYKRIEHVGRIAVVSNTGLAMARGEYVAILDDDDWWLDERKLEKQVAFMDSHPDCVACGGWYAVVDTEGTEIARVQKPEDDAAIRRVALAANPIANSSAFFRRSLGARYDESLKQFADWDFWLMLGKKGKLYNLPEYFLAYRMWHGGSSFMFQRENARAALRIVRRYRDDYPGYPKAIVLATAYLWYTFLPSWVRRTTNRSLSRLKKFLFSR